MGKAAKVDELYRSERLVKLLVLEKRISAANEASITFYDAPTPLGYTPSKPCRNHAIIFALERAPHLFFTA